jgi:hypothetical protein
MQYPTPTSSGEVASVHGFAPFLPRKVFVAAAGTERTQWTCSCSSLTAAAPLKFCSFYFAGMASIPPIAPGPHSHVTCGGCSTLLMYPQVCGQLLLALLLHHGTRTASSC